MHPIEVTPKMLSIWPVALIIAIPLVKPVITLLGIKDTTFPNLNSDAISNITPEIKLATNKPLKPYLFNKQSKKDILSEGFGR